MNQFNMFGDQEPQGNLEIIKGGGKKAEGHRVYFTEYKSEDYMTLSDLFSGYNEIRAITFSYNIKFIDKIMKFFDYGEIILGGRFMVRKDDNIHKLHADTYTFLENIILSEAAADAIRGQEYLVQRMVEGDLLFKSPKYLVDHRKVYLLKADDGRTRVIKGSANMTDLAWSGNQVESYEVDDSLEGYEAYIKDFETAWSFSDEIQEEVVTVEKTGDPEKDIPIINKIEKTKEAIVLEKPSPDVETIEHTKYAIEIDKNIEKNAQLLVGVKLESKKGLIEASAEAIKKIKNNYRKLKSKRTEMKEVQKDYPKLEINYDNKEEFIDKEKLDLNPKEKDVKNDIDTLLKVLSNYQTDFIGDTDSVITSHYKLLNIMFSSPFNAKLRCTAFFYNVPTSSLPLYTLLASTGANTGKTYMTQIILKMMSGKLLPPFTIKEMNTNNLAYALQESKGMPIFVDEIDGNYYRYLKPYIKNSDQCERLLLEQQPLVIFAGNQVKDPEEPERKRMPFLRYETNLKSDLDPVSYKAMGISLQNKMGNALYREYLRRMLDEVCGIIDYIENSKDIPVGYYPDIMNVSSKVLMDIFLSFGYDLPFYVKEYNWNDDFSYHAKHVSESAINEIRKLWKNDPKAFTIKSETIIIKTGSDGESKKMVENWKNSLPPEFGANPSFYRDYSVITINREQLEKRLGFKFNNFNKFFRR